MEIIIAIIIVLLWVSLIELANHIMCWLSPNDDDDDVGNLPKPNPVTIYSVNSIKEDYLMQKYRYTLNMPTMGAADVVMRKLHLTINGTMEILDVDPHMELYKLDLEENSVCSVYIIDIDDVGNASPPSDALEFTVIDTVPPKKPDSIVIGDVEEIFDEPVVEEPVDEGADDDEVIVEEPVVDEPVDEGTDDEVIIEEPVDEGADEGADNDEVIVEEPVVDEPVDEGTDDEVIIEEPVDEGADEGADNDEVIVEEPVVDEPVDEGTDDEVIIEEPVDEGMDSPDEVVVDDGDDSVSDDTTDDSTDADGETPDVDGEMPLK